MKNLIEKLKQIEKAESVLGFWVKAYSWIIGITFGVLISYIFYNL